MNNDQPKKRIANSFTGAEVLAILELLTIARRGGDTRVVMRSTTVVNVERKFRKMARAAHDEGW